MQLPKFIKIGRHRYAVNKRSRARKRGTMGEVCYLQRYIDVVTHSGYTGRAFKSEEMADTFWHEVTHAILHEMQHPYRDNEKFVARFATLLTKAINSAEF